MNLRKWKMHLKYFVLVLGVFILVYYHKATGNLFSKARTICPSITSGSKHPINFSSVAIYGVGIRHERDDAYENDNIAAKDEWLQTINKRNAQAQQYCLKHPESINGPRKGNFYLFEQNHVAYCEVPKNGCTFWKRIMRFLNKDLPADSKNISKPSDIPRRFTHLGGFKTTPTFKLGQKDEVKLQKMTNSFMFARDPYSRLWSAYLDKIFLPDFWNVGRHVVLAERREPKTLSLKCGYDVTFPEFIRFSVRRHSVNWHFAPIYTICDPCRTKFKFIGKQETFVIDAKNVINETGMLSTLGYDIFSDTVVNEIKSLTEDYLNLRKPWLNSVCDNKTLICERLWKVFQINGYIGFEIPFPFYLSKFTNSKRLEKEFIEQAIEIHQNGKPYHEIWKKQRRESLVSAYRAISKETLRSFQNIFKADFEMFGYDKEPADIYGTDAKEIDA